MGHRNTPCFRGVLELLVTPLVSDLTPAVLLQFLDDDPAVHELLYTFSTHRVNLFSPVTSFTECPNREGRALETVNLRKKRGYPP